MALATHCKEGHEYTPDNTIIRENGARRCRVCKNAKGQKYYWEKAEREGRTRVRVWRTTLESIYERSHVDSHGCRMWDGFINGSGYGRTKFQARNWLVHRLVWEIQIGAIPAGMTLDHQCHNEDPDCLGGVTCRHRACFRLGHLRVSTPAANTLAGKTIPAMWVRRTAEGNRVGRAQAWAEFRESPL